jgi:glycosyltransferase involved in cell wall biosynthesis
MSKSPPKLSIVAPCYNEQDGIEEFHRRTSAAAKEVVGENYELIFVNDGSRDASWAVMRKLVARDPRLVLINLARRHGHQLALTAGLELCRGDRVLTIDSDLQDPPELLAEMWRLMDDEGIDIVYGLRGERLGETRFKRWTAALFYWLLQRVGDADIPSNAGDFRLMTRRVVDVLKSMPERHRFIRGMIGWIGFRQIALRYDRNPRFAGSSQYPLSRMMILALDALTGFSIAPLRIASYAGFAVGVLGLLMLVYTLGSWASGRVVDGWTSLTTIVLILGSLQLILFGLLGEYIGRMYIELKQRPLFTIDRIVTHDTESLTTARPAQIDASQDGR